MMSTFMSGLCLLVASCLSSTLAKPVWDDIVELERNIHALTINPRQGPRGKRNDLEREVCSDNQNYLIAYDAGSSGSTMFVFGDETACTLDLLGGEPCDGSGPKCGDIDEKGTSASMGQYWGGKNEPNNPAEWKDQLLSENYADGFQPKESCYGKVCPDFAKFAGQTLKEKWSQPVIKTIEAICGPQVPEECVKKFSFAIGATAGNRIQSETKDADEVDWKDFIDMFKEHETLKHVELLQAATLPGTQEASFELQAVPRKAQGGRAYRNFVSCGGASAQVAVGLTEETAQKFEKYAVYLSEFGQCSEADTVKMRAPLVCGTEQKPTDFMRVEDTPGLGKTGLISFLSGNQESAHPSKPCKTVTNPPTNAGPGKLSEFMEEIEQASLKKANDDCSGYLALHDQGYRLHLVGGMDQAFGADDKTDSDAPVGFGKWASQDGHFDSNCQHCFDGACNSASGGKKTKAEMCKKCIKTFISWDVQYILTKQAAVDMMACPKTEVDHHAYAVAQVFASWKRAQGDVSADFKEISDNYASNIQIQARQFKENNKATVDFGKKACLTQERKKYHGQWALLYTFAVSEAMGFGTLEWEKGEPAEWIDGMAASNGFKADNVVTLQTPFKCEKANATDPERFACPWNCKKSKSCKDTIQECEC